MKKVDSTDIILKHLSLEIINKKLDKKNFLYNYFY